MGAKELSKTVKQEIKIDEKAGSMAYNRLDMQVSQALYMAIELYDSLDYLFVMDQYDDITIFDISSDPFLVSYYQMKTHESSICIDTVLSHKWLAKLYRHFDKPEWLIKELGLITNCELDISFKVEDSQGKTIKRKKTLNAERTPFCKFPIVVVDRIKNDLSERLNIPCEEVDLSKFVHMRTVLAIANHRDIAEHKVTQFLSDRYSGIKVETAKIIFKSMLTLLSEKQSYERLGDNADFGSIVRKKGVYKKDIKKIIDDSILISMPQASDILKMARYFGEEERGKIGSAYMQVVADQECQRESYKSVIYKVKEIVIENPYTGDIGISEHLEKLCESLYSRYPNLRLIYDKYYIIVLAMSIIIKETRN